MTRPSHDTIWFFGVIGTVFAIIAIIVYFSIRQTNNERILCNQAGGDLLLLRNKSVCLKKGTIINYE